jgi:hypothetical protein
VHLRDMSLPTPVHGHEGDEEKPDRVPLSHNLRLVSRRIVRAGMCKQVGANVLFLTGEHFSNHSILIQNEKGMQKLLESKFPPWSGCFSSSGSRWTARRGRYGLENGYRDPDLLPCQGCVRDGRKVTTRALLLGQVSPPAVAQPFLAEVRGAKAQAVTEGKTEAKAEAKEKDKK